MNTANRFCTDHKVKIGFLLCSIGVYLTAVLSGGNYEESLRQRVLSGGKYEESFRQRVPIKEYRVFVEVPGGRLGNKLYHLAASYAIALKNHRKLVLTPKFNGRIKTLLNISYLDAEIANVPNDSKIQTNKKSLVFKYESELELNDTDFKPGYIQVMKYFLPYASTVRNHMVINDNLVSSTQEFLHSLHLAPNSTFVGIHVRRGDRANENWMKLGQMIPRLQYLKNAMAYFLSKYTNVNFIVCSDDISWCKQNLKKGMLNCVSEYGTHFSSGKSAEWDMALLAQCNHSIVTVGTFGWWGAWFAGGETIYFNHPFSNGSRLGKKFINENYFWPTWIGMGDK